MMELNHLFTLPRDRSPGIGCVGSGFVMAECHLAAYRDAGFNVVAIASRSPERAKEVARRHNIGVVHNSYRELLDDDRIHVVDIAVPPDVQFQVLRDVAECRRNGRSHIRAVLAQKPLGVSYAQAKQIVELCHDAGIVLAVNQNMRFDQSVRACKDALDRGYLGESVLATIDMRAIPHWMPWQQRLGWLTLRIMSIHHLDTFRYWFGEPNRVFASVRTDPRTEKRFEHHDGICLYILEYGSGLRALSCDDVWAGPVKEGASPDTSLTWRVEGTHGIARGTIGWPGYPHRVPSTIDFTTTQSRMWHTPRWQEVWFPDAFAGPMAELLGALEENREPSTSGEDNLKTMALVEACYLSASSHRAVMPQEVMSDRAFSADDPTPYHSAPGTPQTIRRSAGSNE